MAIVYFILFGHKDKAKNLKINGNKSVNEGAFLWSYSFKVGQTIKG